MVTLGRLLQSLTEWWSHGGQAVATRFILFTVASTAVSMGAVIVVVVRLPADYFRAPAKPPRRSGVFALPLIIARNLFGWLVVLTGCVLMFPGVPGQGLLMVLAGLTLADFPRKFELQKRLIKLPGLRSAADAVRVRFGRVPFEL